MSPVKTIHTILLGNRFAIWLLITGSLSILPAAPQARRVATRSLDGGVLFRDYCASCHGGGGEGNGPAAAGLNVSVPNLTLLAKRAGEFPRKRIRNILEGAESPVAHGSRKMPVWGPLFHEIDEDQDLGNVRIDNVIKYIETLQRK